MIFFNKGQIAELVGHCKREAPNEACGILAGKEGRVAKVYQMANQDKSGKTFFMEPKEQLKVMKEIRNLGWEIAGIYHSHLETEPYPSAHDVKLAYSPDVSYVIISLKDRDNPKVLSFRIVEGKIEAERICGEILE